MPIGTAHTDVSLFLGRSRSVCSGDVGLFLSLGFYLLGLGRCFQFGSFENDAAHDGLGNLFVACLSHSPRLVVEQTDSGEGHGDAILVTGSDNMVVAYAATRLGHIFHATLVSALNVVAKGEEGI